MFSVDLYIQFLLYPHVFRFKSDTLSFWLLGQTNFLYNLDFSFFFFILPPPPLPLCSCSRSYLIPPLSSRLRFPLYRSLSLPSPLLSTLLRRLIFSEFSVQFGDIQHPSLGCNKPLTKFVFVF